MGFPWDGDEVRFPKDLKLLSGIWALAERGLAPGQSRTLRHARRRQLGYGTGVQTTQRRGQAMVCGGGILSFYRDAPKTLRDRGDMVWYYGGPPSVKENAAAITEFPLRAWLWGVNGYVHWLTVAPGEDPWFHFDGGGTVLVYSGDRFGITEPFPASG